MPDPKFPPMPERIRTHAVRLLEDADQLGMDQEADGALGELIDSIIEISSFGVEVFSRDKFLAAIAVGSITVHASGAGDRVEEMIRDLERLLNATDDEALREPLVNAINGLTEFQVYSQGLEQPPRP